MIDVYSLHIWTKILQIRLVPFSHLGCLRIPFPFPNGVTLHPKERPWKIMVSILASSGSMKTRLRLKATLVGFLNCGLPGYPQSSSEFLDGDFPQQNPSSELGVPPSLSIRLAPEDHGAGCFSRRFPPKNGDFHGGTPSSLDSFCWENPI